MRARHMIAMLIAVVTVATACSSSKSQKATPNTNRQTETGKPNIVFVLTDDLDRREISYLPTVRKLVADQGMTLDNYFVSNSLCCPSRTTMLRGQYAHDSGVHSNSGPDGGFNAFDDGADNDTIGTWMQEAGYATALYGKFLNGYPGQAG